MGGLDRREARPALGIPGSLLAVRSALGEEAHRCTQACDAHLHSRSTTEMYRHPHPLDARDRLSTEPEHPSSALPHQQRLFVTRRLRCNASHKPACVQKALLNHRLCSRANPTSDGAQRHPETAMSAKVVFGPPLHCLPMGGKERVLLSAMPSPTVSAVLSRCCGQEQ